MPSHTLFPVGVKEEIHANNVKGIVWELLAPTSVESDRLLHPVDIQLWSCAYAHECPGKAVIPWDGQ